MEYGIISLLPPVVAIGLALWSKQTILSLIVAVWLGSTIINGWNPIVGLLQVVPDFLIPSIADEWNASLLILVTVAGGFVHMLRTTGAAKAFANMVRGSIDSPKKAQVATWGSAFVFSYTEPCLILGTIMRPITDASRVSRAKLAYILDSMGVNLASFSPISSYGPFITGLIATQLAAANLTDNSWGVWAQMLTFNMYGGLAMLTVLIVALFGLNFGSMYREERRARKTGQLLPDGVEPIVPEIADGLDAAYSPKPYVFVLPLLGLFGTLFAVIFYTGDVMANGFVGSFLEGSITLAITMGFLVGGLVAGIVGVVDKTFKPLQGFDNFVQGMADMIYVPFILVSAWAIGKVTGAMGVGAFLSDAVAGFLAPGLVPALVFVISAAIAFATGSSWGVWAIMMPIAFPMAVAFDLPVAFIAAAVVGGGLFGDQCSPISDTTIMSSTGAMCNHILHVNTQLPYGLSVGVAAISGFLLGGLTGLYYLGWVLALVILLAILVVMHRSSYNKAHTRADLVTQEA